MWQYCFFLCETPLYHHFTSQLLLVVLLISILLVVFALQSLSDETLNDLGHFTLEVTNDHLPYLKYNAKIQSLIDSNGQTNSQSKNTRQNSSFFFFFFYLYS